MKVLVTGATGFVGHYVVKDLLKAGHSVVTLSRNPTSAQASLGVPSFAWNPEKEVPSAEALKGVEGIVHLAGEGIANKRWSEAQKKKILDSRVLSTANLVKGMNQMATKPKVFVCASAIGFYGNRGSERLTEDSAVGSGFLADVCAAWEKTSHAIDSSIRLVNLRIGIVLGSEGGALKKLLPIFKLGMGGPVGAGDQFMSWVHVEDVSGVVIHALEKEAVRGPLNTVAPQAKTNKEFSTILGQALHRPAFMPAPAFALKLAMGELSALVLHSQNVVPQKALSTGYVYRYPELLGALTQIVKKKS